MSDSKKLDLFKIAPKNTKKTLCLFATTQYSSDKPEFPIERYCHYWNSRSDTSDQHYLSRDLKYAFQCIRMKEAIDCQDKCPIDSAKFLEYFDITYFKTVNDQQDVIDIIIDLSKNKIRVANYSAVTNPNIANNASALVHLHDEDSKSKIERGVSKVQCNICNAVISDVTIYNHRATKRCNAIKDSLKSDDPEGILSKPQFTHL